MGLKKILLFIAVFFMLSLLQISFLPHFSFAGWVPNVVMVSLVILASFAVPSGGVAAALTGGFVLDLYSSFPFGSWVILSLVVFFAARYIFKNYVRIPQGI